MNTLLPLSISDFKLVFRDSSLRIFLVMPLLIFLVVLLAMPYFIEQYDNALAFLSIVLMGASVQTSIMFGFIYSMVLINEKDLHVAKVYGILPVSKTGFTLSRLVLPFLMACVMTFLLLFIQPFYEFNLLAVVVISVLCGLMAPLLTLLVAIFSKNKMEGMTWFKLINLLVSLPLASFFIPKYASLFGVLPSYWAFQSLHFMIEGLEPTWTLATGFTFTLLLLVVLVKRFTKVHFR